MHHISPGVGRRILSIQLIIASAGLLLLCQTAESAKNKPIPEQKDSAAAGKVVAPAIRDSADTPVVARPAQEQRVLMVYYFHTTFRCPSCNKIEKLTRQAVGSGFGEQLKKGRIEFQSVNIETPGNEHFAEEYKLYTKSVILSDRKNGKEATWKNLDQVWTLLRDDNKFIAYIQKEINAFLKG